jgi:hypothetical protein
MLDIENLGLLGVFIAGAIPWMEAITEAMCHNFLTDVW